MNRESSRWWSCQPTAIWLGRWSYSFQKNLVVVVVVVRIQDVVVVVSLSPQGGERLLFHPHLLLADSIAGYTDRDCSWNSSVEYYWNVLYRVCYLLSDCNCSPLLECLECMCERCVMMRKTSSLSLCTVFRHWLKLIDLLIRRPKLIDGDVRLLKTMMFVSRLYGLFQKP